jgi:hypothetical protein
MNLGTKFQKRISSALLVIFIKATGMFLLYIQPKYCPEICCVFFQASSLSKMAELIKMALATTESKLYASASLILLNAENLKESLQMLCVVIMFMQLFVKICYLVQI